MKRLLFLLAPIFIYAGSSTALAHGGFHPTPWPEPQPPTDTPVPPPTPPAQPTPQPTPTPAPDPSPTPSDDPPDQPAPTPATPQPPTELVDPGEGSGIMAWQRWWEIHAWKWTRVGRVSAVETPSSGEQSATEDSIEPFLSEALKHPYFDVRSAAALSLGKARMKAAAPLVEALLKDRNPAVAESACLALGMLQSHESIAALARIVENRSSPERLRIHAALAIGLSGQESYSSSLLALARSESADIESRAAALQALSLLKNEAGFDEMVRMIQTRSAREELLAAAATALSKSGAKTVGKGENAVDTADFLLKALDTYRKDRHLRRAIATGLPELAPFQPETAQNAARRIVAAISQEKDDVTRGFLIASLGELAPTLPNATQVFRIIRNYLQHEKGRESKCFSALAAGIGGDRESLPLLRSGLRSGATETRAACALALGLLKDVESTQDLSAEIGARLGSPVLKGYCCLALGLMGMRDNKEAFPPLKNALQRSNIPEVRAAAAKALALLGASDALEPLLMSVREDNYYFKLSAILAVGEFRNPKANVLLIELYRSSAVNDETRAMIIVALGNIAEPAGEPVLSRLSRRWNFLILRFATFSQIVRLL